MSGIGETVLYVEDPDAIPREATVLEVHAYHDSGMPKAYKLRINTGFRQAWSIVSAQAEKVFPKLPEEEHQANHEFPNMEHHEQEREVPHEETHVPISEARTKTVTAIVLVVAIAIGSFYYFLKHSGGEERLQIISDTMELNEINLKDSSDLQIKRDAQSRIDGRAVRKKELIKSIGYE